MTFLTDLLLRKDSNDFPHNLLIYLCIGHCSYSALSIEDMMENKTELVIHQNLVSGDISLNCAI